MLKEIGIKFWRLIHILYKAAEKTINDDGVEHAGYMAFMVILSLFPFIVFLLALTSFVGASEIGEEFIQIIINNLPGKEDNPFTSRIIELKKAPPTVLLSLAIFGTIWTASSFVEGLRTILNRIYEVSSPPTYVWRRLLSLMQFIIISITISLVMFLLILVPIGINKLFHIDNIFNTLGAFWNYLRYLIICISLFLTVISLYFFIPNKKMSLKCLVPGALITVGLWLMVGSLLSSYLSYYNQFSVVYGSIGSIIISMLFFYIINMIFIYGAEFNYLFYLESKNS